MTVLPTQSIGGHEALQRSLDAVKEQLELQNLPVEALIKAGNPAASLNAYAEEINANLILIGAQGLRATLGILLGGVAQQVVEYSQCPVLVVRAPYTGINRVLLVTDGSPHSQRAVEYLARSMPRRARREQAADRCKSLSRSKKPAKFASAAPGYRPLPG